jgi:hypothetical protein
VTDDVMMDDEDADGIEVSLTEVLEDTIALALQSMAGPVVGVIDSYDATSNRAAIAPAVPLLVAGETLQPPKLPAVPVCWYGSPTFGYKFPLVKGVLVVLAPLGHDHGGWMASGAPNVRPVSDRRFSLADLVAYPVAPSPTSAPPDPSSYSAAAAVLFGLHLVGSNAATDFVALASKVLTELQAIKNSYDTHTHVYNPGPGAPTTTAVPVPLLTAPGSVACTKLKAE